MPSELPRITVETRINAPVAKVWKHWVTPDEVMKWNVASDDWHTPSTSNDLRVGGTFNYRMEAKDGSAAFDFAGKYTEIQTHALIAYRMEDDRDVRISFEPVWRRDCIERPSLPSRHTRLTCNGADGRAYLTGLSGMWGNSHSNIADNGDYDQ